MARHEPVIVTESNRRDVIEHTQRAVALTIALLVLLVAGSWASADWPGVRLLRVKR